MTRRRYNFLRLTALLMIVLGLISALISIVVGVILIVRPSLIMPPPETAEILNNYRVTGMIVIVSGLIGGLVLAAMGQFYQAFLEMLEVNRLQVKGLKALVDR